MRRHFGEGILQGAMSHFSRGLTCPNGVLQVDARENERLRLKAEVFKAMGHPIRLGVIEFLQQGEVCVCDIVEHVGTGMSNVSKHLSVLKKAGIIADRRDGLKIMYRLTMPCAVDFVKCVEGVVLGRLDDQRALMAG